MFPAPRPSNLITVAACSKCHDGTSLDDARFIALIAQTRRIRPNAAAAAIQANVVRSLARPEARRERIARERRISRVQFVTGTGLWAGTGIGAVVDIEPVHRVAQRIVRGLHFHVLGERVPEGCEVIARHFMELERDRAMTRAEIDAFIATAARDLPGNRVGDEVFAYRYGRHSKAQSLWVLGFYGAADFVVQVRPLLQEPGMMPRRPIAVWPIERVR
jgi:hypothetical protein